jgi:hypothetical protein
MAGTRRVLAFLGALVFASGSWATQPARLYPGVARLSGQNKTAWRSSAVLYNPTASTQSALLELLPRGASAVAVSTTVELAAGQTREIANLYDFLQAGDGAGMLRITGSVMAWVRTYNEGHGTFGQDLHEVTADAAFAAHSAVAFPFSSPATIARDFRSNLMLVNLETVDITVTVTSGELTTARTVPAGAYVQVDNLGGALGAPAGFGTAVVVADGTWFGVISTIDPFTGDPTTVRGLPSVQAGQRFFVGVAQSAGANGAAWRSEAVLYNPTDEPVSTTLELLPRGTDVVRASGTVQLAARETRRIPSLYEYLGAPDGAGTLRVTGPALVWLRTHNQRPHAGDTTMETFGQDLPPVASEGGIAPHAFIAVPFNTPADTATGFRSNLLLQNLDDHDITVSLAAGGASATRVIPAGSYVQVDKLGTVLGADLGEGCAWGIADGRWAASISTIDPLTNDPTTFRAARGWQPPSSSDLIDQAVANHLITAEEALTYRVFAAVGDPRLPAAYRGDDRGVREPEALTDAALQFETLSAATQDLVGPYLVPPFAVGSAWDLRHGGGAGSGSSSIPGIVCRPWQSWCGYLTSWDHVTGAHVRVWYLSANNTTDRSIADDFVAQAEFHIWGLLKDVMGIEALLRDNGDGPHLDIELVDADVTGPGILALTIPYPKSACNRITSHIAILRTIGTLDLRRGTLAHEMMHAFQFALGTDRCNKGYTWLSEATATWFEDHSYPGGDTEQEYAPTYLDSTELSLEDRSIKNREYSAYMFFFYLTRVRGLPATVIGDVWKATVGADALHAVDTGISKNGTTLDKVWPEFALYCWNEDRPYNTFRTLDRLSKKASLQATLAVAGNRPGLVVLAGKADITLPHLSMRFFQVDPDSVAVSSMTFYNGLTRSLDDLDVPLFGTVLSANELPTVPKGAHVDALIKKGGLWTHSDWTEKSFQSYCLDRANDRVDRLVLVLSNADIATAKDVTVQGTHSPGIMGSNIGCAKWEGSADLRYKLGDEGASEHFVATGVRLESTDPTMPGVGFLVSRPYDVTAGTLSWSVSGTNSNCDTIGVASGISAVNPGNIFSLFDWVVSGVGYRSLQSAIFFPWLEPHGVIKFSCPPPAVHADEGWHGADVVLAVSPSIWAAQVSANGKTLELNMSKAPAGTFPRVTGTWTLHAQREP